MELNTIQEMRQILDAIEQGKSIQWYDDQNDEWDDTTNKRPNFCDIIYRIKPEKKLRPFKDVDEFIKAAGGLGAIWLKRETVNQIHSVVCLDYSAKYQPIRLDFGWQSFDNIFKDFTFLDGTPCGVEE